ncbi:hypothetical protein JCM8097_007545 [Rhodosporidiobolus ruineniae]
MSAPASPATDEVGGANEVEEQVDTQTKASPFDRLPDELITPIFEELFLSTDTNPRCLIPPMELSQLVLSRRLFALARPVWLRWIYRNFGKQESLYLGLLLHADARPLVKHIGYNVQKAHLHHELGLLTRLPNLTSLYFTTGSDFKVEDSPFTSHTLVPSAVTETLRSLVHLRHLELGSYGLKFEDKSFTLADLPQLISLESDMIHDDGVRQLLRAVPPTLRRIQITVNDYPCPILRSIPWSRLAHITVCTYGDADSEPHCGRAILENLGMLNAEPEVQPRLQYFRLTKVQDTDLSPGWDGGFPFSVDDFALLVERLTALQVSRLVLLFPSLLDWAPATFQAPSITTLELQHPQYLSDTISFRNLLRFLSLFPNLSTLILHKADFSPTNDADDVADDNATPSATDPSFLLYYPHVVALVRFLEPTQVRHLVWQSTFGSRWTWDRTGPNDEWTTDRTGCSTWE